MSYNLTDTLILISMIATPAGWLAVHALRKVSAAHRNEILLGKDQRGR